jgi:hypothetical protein
MAQWTQADDPRAAACPDDHPTIPPTPVNHCSLPMSFSFDEDEDIVRTVQIVEQQQLKEMAAQRWKADIAAEEFMYPCFLDHSHPHLASLSRQTVRWCC